MPTKATRRLVVRLALVFLIVVIGVFSAFFLMPVRTAHAIDLGYPWAGASTVPGGLYEWGYTTCPANASSCMILKGYGTDGQTYGESDPYGYVFRNCTSFVAWKLASLGVPVSYIKGLGNGGQWYDNAANKTGLTRGTSPQVGDAAVIPATYDSNGNLKTYGHVAYVDKVNYDSNGNVTTIEIQQSNWDLMGNQDQRTVSPSQVGFTEFVHFGPLMTNPPSGSTSTPTATTTILSLKSTRSPNNAIETFAATNSRVTENWYYDGGTGPQTRAIIDIAQNNIVAIDKLNIDSTELLYTAVSDGVWESTWAADSGIVTSSKPVTGLTGLRSVFAENTFDSSGYRIHHLYILASDGPYEAYWKDSDPTHTVHVGRLTQINGGIAMAHSIGPDGSEQLYVAVPTWVYEVSWFPGGTINTRPVINIPQGDIRSVEKGANLPDGGQPLYTTTSTTVWQTYWNGSSGFSNGTIATNQVNSFQSLKLVTPDGVHHVYLATPDHVQEYWWPPAFGGGELIRISQANIAAIAQQLDGTTQLLLTAAGSNVWETWWDSSHAPTTPSSPLFSVAK